MKKFTTELTLVIGLLLTSLGLLAQDSNTTEKATKNKQLGLRFRNLDSFGVQYKSGKGKTKFRFTAVSLYNLKNDDINTSNFSERKNSNSGIELNLGFERHHAINDDFILYNGLDIGVDFQKNKSEYTRFDDFSNDFLYTTKSEDKRNSISLGIVLGAQYAFNNRFSLSAEIIPSVRYTKSESEYESISDFQNNLSNNENDIFSFNLNNRTALTVSYHF